MAQLTGKAPVADAKLKVGAYVRKGICLYRVDRRTPSQIILEDAYMGKEIPTTCTDVLANYLLVKP
jgi:hypothetical protein